MKDLLLKYYRIIKLAIFKIQTSQHLNYEGFQIVLPSKHSISTLLRLEPFRNSVLRSVSEFVLTNERNHVVDVGANIGDTALTIFKASRVPTKFTLIEPSEFFRDFLIQNSRYLQDYEIIPKFVSPHFPIVDIAGDFLHWGGTAQIVESKNSIISSTRQILLHDVVRGDTGLIKIDCDGQDTTILKIFLENSNFHPAIYFENTITDAPSLNNSCQTINLAFSKGYEYAIISRSDGLVIWAGQIGTTHLIDIFWLQLNVRRMDRPELMYHTDILLVHKDNKDGFNRIIKNIRDDQQNDT